MSDRSSIVVDRDVKEQLDEQKGKWETWSGLLSEAADLLAKHHDPSGPEEDTND
jgi:hypothetical protein